jgi:hypothetical protein
MADIVEIFLTLRNARQFIEQADASAKAVGGIGTKAEESGKKAGIGWKGIAKWAGGAAAIYGATRYITGAVSATDDLARSTLQVQRVTNMDTQTASAWVGVLKERNVSSQQFGRSLATLSKQMESARTGTAAQSQEMALLNKQYKATELLGGKKAPAALAALSKQMQSVQAKGEKARETMKLLGVPMRDIATGNTQDVLLHVADAFKTMTNPAERAALAQKLFGRAAQGLLPILLRGRKGIEDALGTQIKYGNVLGGKSITDTEKYIARQRQLKAAMAGLKITLGTALMPVIGSFAGLLVKVTNVMQPLLRQGWLVKSLIVALTIAFIAYKAAVIAATIASWDLDAAMLANPIGLTIVALIALGAIFVVLYKKVGWFRSGVQWLWREIKIGYEWAKKNWPLLVGILAGPFGVAAALIITHFGAVKSFVLGVVDAIKRAMQSVLNIVHKVTGPVGKILSKIPGAGLLHKIPGFATGGVMPYAGPAIVGEAGPELLHLPGGTTITPLPKLQQFQMAGMGAGNVEIVVPLYLNGRVLAQAVAQYSANKLARK